MNSTLTFLDVKNLFNYIDNDKIVIWELFYKPKKKFFGFIRYDDKLKKEVEFDTGIIITILNSDNVYYQIITTSFRLHNFDLLKMVMDPMFIVGDLNMTWLNFLIFKKLPMNIIRGWFFISDYQAEVTITHIYNRLTNGHWQDTYENYQKKNSVFPIYTPIVTELKGYEKISSIHSMYTMPDISMVIRNIDSISCR